MTEQKHATRGGDTLGALRRIFGTLPIDESALRNLVCTYADEMKRLGWPVERIIINIKRVGESEDGLYRLEMTAAERLYVREMTSRAVTWCVEHYFSTQPT